MKKNMKVFLFAMFLAFLPLVLFLPHSKDLSQKSSTPPTSTIHLSDEIPNGTPKEIPTETPKLPKVEAVVVLDPGHGGKEEGAKGWTTNVLEKDIALSMAKSAQSWLKQHNIQVFLTRIGDYQLDTKLKTDLELRAKFAAQTSIQGSIFVSIHVDQFNRKVQGTKVYYSKLNPLPIESKQLAETIHTTLVDEIGSVPLGVHFNDFLVLKENVVPAILVEVGHLSNKEEEMRLIDPTYQEQAGIGIAKGILVYLTQKKE